MPGCPPPGPSALVNLVLCLLSTRQFLPAEKIRATVPGYADAASDEAFFRMFERDKTELRELGVPAGDRPQLRVRHHRRLPHRPPGLRARRDRPRAGRGGRGRAGRPPVGHPGPGRGGARRGAQAARGRGGGRRDGPGPVQPRVRAVEPAFGPLLAAVQAGQVVTFPHRRGGPTGEVDPADRGAVGRGLGAGPLVPGRPRPRPGGRPLVPALPDRRAGDDARRRRAAVQVPPGVDLLAVVDRGGRACLR